MRNEYAQETALVAEEERGEEGEGEKEEKSREGKRERKREEKREEKRGREGGREGGKEGGRKVCSQTWLASKSTEQLVNRMLETPSNLTSMARMQHVTFLSPLLPTGSLF